MEEEVISKTIRTNTTDNSAAHTSAQPTSEDSAKSKPTEGSAAENDHFARRDKLVERIESLLRKRGLDPSVLYET